MGFFEVNQEMRSNVVLLALIGELDYHECKPLQLVFNSIIKEKGVRVVLDVTKVEYLDSSGLGLFLGFSKEVGHVGGKLVMVYSENETIKSILSLTRLDGIFKTADTVEEAIAKLEEGG